jgi:nitrogen fixation/metabolism regulation signal transduction histidine kinase
MVWIFGVLATLPILLVYFFAVQFLNKGIDSWFNVEIRQSLDDALVLSLGAGDACAASGGTEAIAGNRSQVDDARCSSDARPCAVELTARPSRP